VFQPGSIPMWTAISAIAGILQAALLIINAAFVWRYLQETKRLRLAAQQQVAAAGGQLEAQIRPGIVFRVGERGGYSPWSVDKAPRFISGYQP
jgi:hypothetical protein